MSEAINHGRHRFLGTAAMTMAATELGMIDLADAQFKKTSLAEATTINPGDPTNDGSIAWPDDRKRVELGTLTLTAVAPDNEALQRKLAFNPTYLTDGIQLSDDPFPPLRSAVYALSVQHRGPAPTPTH